jgi:hypothetical protein
MTSAVFSYLRAIVGKRRWFVLSLPPLLMKGVEWAYPAWRPARQDWVWAILVGILLATILAWYEESSNNHQFTSTLPRIVLADNPVDISPFTVFLTIEGPAGAVRVPGRTYTALRLRFVNRPKFNSERGEARAIHAHVTFFDARNERLFTMDGRWSDSPQLVERDAATDYVASLAVPFPIGAARSLDFVAYHAIPPYCIAVNNDNFRAPDLVMPGRALTGTVTAQIDLNGPGIKCTARIKFDCLGLHVHGRVEFEDGMPD